MVITAIKQQQKRADKYSVFINEKYAFSLSANELLNQKLSIGQELDNEMLTTIHEAASLDKAYVKSLDYISRRPRSVWEMEQYLKKCGCNDNAKSIIINRLTKKNYLNDEDFAKSWVKNRRKLKLASKRRIYLELQQKHITNDVINKVFENENVNELDIINELINKKKSQSRYADKQKLITYLLRQGFNYEDVRLCILE